MDLINSVGGVSSSQPKKIERTDSKLQSAIGKLVDRRLSDEVSPLSTATRLQAGSTPLREVSTNLAEVATKVSVAGEGLRKIERKLQNLQSKAEEAKEKNVPAARRETLGAEVNSAAKAIDDVVKDTTFSGVRVLDGALGGEKKLSLDTIVNGTPSQAGDISLSIEDVSSSALLKGKAPDVSTPEAAAKTAELAGNAQALVGRIAKEAETFRQSVEIVSAYIDSAAANHQAAQSVLTESDFEKSSLLDDIRRNPSAAIAAQGNKLNPELVKLVS